MAYTDDAVLAKLSALNETQESIVTVAQWVMFHRRHADRTGQLWLSRLRDSASNKRLNLIYLANEVVQQSKARRKDDFLIAFSPVIAEATAIAYKGASNEIQTKLRRVVEVWRERRIFEIPIQEAIESRIEELDKSRTSGKRAGGSSIFSSSTNPVPKELEPLVAPQQTISKLVLSTKTSVNAATQDYERLTDPSAAVPSAPVHAARLNGLLKTLANAEGAVAESIKARKVLIEALEKILDTNRTALASEESQLADLSTQRTEIDAKKKDVEDSIMRGFASNSNPSTPVGPDGSPTQGSHMPITPAPEPDRPEVEEFTPPSYADEPDIPESEPEPTYNLHADQIGFTGQLDEEAPAASVYHAPPNSISTGSGSVKKRKLNDSDDFPDLGGDDGLDADVAEMLRSGN
ncbi:RNA polymerase II-binding domain-containing protein [Xylogone sp. PMI_703]|nr:RNA polymerase II-binding domain-containing protein [Xylogone sp. PMI_703]